MTRVMRWLLFASLLACTKSNPNFCAENPGADCRIDAPFACKTNEDCSGMASGSVCEPESGTCVRCTAQFPESCSGTTPVCGSSHECVACSQDGDCASAVCLPSGACAADGAVLHTSPSGPETATCSSTDPCSLTHALALVDATRKVIQLAGGTYTFSTTVTLDKELTLFGRDAVIDHNGTDGSTIRIGPNGKVDLDYVTIIGADGMYGHGIESTDSTATLRAHAISVLNNQRIGIDWSGASLTLVVSRIAQNGGGGVRVMGSAFKITGNVFWANGSDASTVGGVSIGGSLQSTNRLDFNSFTRNSTQDGLGAAVNCNGALSARNNIMSFNGTLTNAEQVSGTCSHTYSIVRPGSLPSGIGNAASDPLFVNTATGDLHIQTGSPALSAADPTSDLSDVAAHDLDGQLRQAPADIGADEVP